MSLLFRHFALVLIVVAAINAAIASRRIPDFVGDHPDARTEATRFVWQTAMSFIVLFLVLEILTVMSGASSPLCYLPLTGAGGSRRYIAWGIWLGWIGGVTLWILFGRGAERVARYGPLFARTSTPGQAYSTGTIRLLAIMWCVGSLAIPLAFPSNQRTRLNCPGSGAVAQAI